MKIINLTPHAINFYTPNGINTINPSGVIARAGTISTPNGVINDIPVVSIAYGNIEGLPAPEPDTIYVVSSIVASAVKGRDDVFVPNDFIRDDNGNIIGARNLGKIL